MEMESNKILEEVRSLVVAQAAELACMRQEQLGRRPKKRVKFVKYIDDWLKLQTHLSENTAVTYWRQQKNHIVPYFSKLNKYIDQITSCDIEDFYNDRRKHGLSANTVIRLHAQVFSAFKHAVKNGDVIRNPMDGVSRPKESRYISNWLDAEQIGILLESVAEQRIFVPVLMAVTLGLRRSEIMALRWESINLSLGTISIREKTMSVKGREKVVKKLKNKSSYRTLILPDNLLALFKEIKEMQQEAKKSLPVETHKMFQFVCAEKDGRMMSLNGLTCAFHSFISKSPTLPQIRFHDLRHSCATFLLHNGRSMRDVQDWLGHSNYATTAKFYSHVNIDDKHRTANTMNKVFEKCAVSNVKGEDSSTTEKEEK